MLVLGALALEGVAGCSQVLGLDDVGFTSASDAGAEAGGSSGAGLDGSAGTDAAWEGHAGGGGSSGAGGHAGAAGSAGGTAGPGGVAGAGGGGAGGGGAGGMSGSAGSGPVTCGELASQNGWASGLCETAGNANCGGVGPATSDCVHCCDADLTVWPNPVSAANSDVWLAQNHDAIRLMRPRVLVINFVNAAGSAQAAASRAQEIIEAVAEGSRYHGYADASAPAFMQYQVVKVVDLADLDPGAINWTHLNSSHFPIKCDSSSWYQFNYSALFDSEFKNLIGIEDPSAPGTLLSLGQMLQRGIVNEVWLHINGDPDPYDCPNGVHMNDFQLPESLELKQRYDYSGNKVAGQFDCAGNGCFSDDDVATIQPLGVSVRIGYINSTRGAGCFLESLSHSVEGMCRGAVPYLQRQFQHFANFDLHERFGVSFSSWYDICSNGNCVVYDSNNSVQWHASDGSSGSMNPFNQGCGNVHFAPNGRYNYDMENTFPVLSTCEHYGLKDGPGGTDATDLFTNAKAHQYDSVAPDCMGAWLVYWRQNFPGHQNAAHDTEGNPMKNWWPFLFY